MGVYAEERAEMMGLNDIYEESDFSYWTMRDGTKIKIADMVDSHLINTIRMLERKGSKLALLKLYPPYIYLKAEAIKRKLI